MTGEHWSEDERESYCKMVLGLLLLPVLIFGLVTLLNGCEARAHLESGPAAPTPAISSDQHDAILKRLDVLERRCPE